MKVRALATMSPGTLQETARLSSEEASPDVKEGLRWLRMGEPAGARVFFETFVKRAPLNANAWVLLGIALAADAEVYQAVGAFEKALGLQPRHFYAHAKLAELYLEIRALNKAVYHLDQARHSVANAEHERMVIKLSEEARRAHEKSAWRPAFERPLGWFPAIVLAVIVSLLAGFAIWGAR